MILVALKLLFLFVGVLFTIVNMIRVIYKNNIPVGNVLLNTVSIVGFLVIQFNLWK